jgi:hypothetical protein
LATFFLALGCVEFSELATDLPGYLQLVYLLGRLLSVLSHQYIEVETTIETSFTHSIRLNGGRY